VWLRTLAILLATLLVTTSCAHRQSMSREQRRECRRLRTKAALTGVGVTVGMAVVATVLVVAVAASRGGSIGSGSSGAGRRRRERRRERRRLRHEVCYGTLENTPAEPPNGPIVEAPPAPVASAGSGPAAPPTEDQLSATFGGIEDEVRACLGIGEVVTIDVSIDGPSGRVTGFGLQDMVATETQRRCLGAQLSRMRFPPFDDEMRVRFAIDLGWVPPPPGGQPQNDSVD